MEVDKPPDPPDPGENVTIPQAPQASQPASRKRPYIETTSDETSRRSLYVHPSLEQAPKKYGTDGKGPFITYVSREVPIPLLVPRSGQWP